MQIFVITTCIAFLTIVAVAVLINWSKRRLRKTPHGLTGMCHKTGGVVCSSCVEHLLRKADDANRDI
ncbi:MAG: hypothetical protein D3924_16185 [Candidatus Electrothrix sp. AR4]|nr:hypothetical protein [Candidatus Electrothrix sp. AR4]